MGYGHHGEETLSEKESIRRRRTKENLPTFGDLVEHADEHHLQYHEVEDARNIELFFDLFFVAIFSTFTKNHEINSSESLSSYSVYFGVIWASWLQIALYDVRFGSDSVFERFTKAVQMCMFIGFASATGCLELNPPSTRKKPILSGFESLNVLMIISRFLFAIQYFVAYYFVGRKHRPATVPLLATSAMYTFVSVIYGLMFKFLLLDAGQTKGFYGYYAIIVFELAIMSFLAYRYECISFKNTHLHKRLMVLTLMILGEGIIICAFGFAKISSKTGWTTNSFGQALCVILSIYFLYCLYFGNSGIELARDFGAAKQQIYTMLHMPFHLCLALTLEGLRTWTIISNVQYNFRKVGGYVDQVIGQTPDVYRLSEFNATTGVTIVQTLNSTIASFGFDDSNSWNAMQKILTQLQFAWQDNATTLASVPGVAGKDGILKFYYSELSALFQNEQFIANSLVVPQSQIDAANGSGLMQMAAYSAVFKMIFIYFFICTSFLLIILGVFRAMSIGPRDHFDTAIISTRMLIGLGLGCLGLLALMDTGITNYINSGFLLPTLLFALTLIVLFEKLLTNIALEHVRIAIKLGLTRTSLKENKTEKEMLLEKESV